MKHRNKMTDTMEETASSMTDGAHDALAAVSNSMIKAIDQNRVIAQNFLRAMQEESLRFMNARIEHTSQTFERSRECQGISAFIALQHDWLMEMAHDYAELNKRCGDLFSGITEQTVETASDIIAHHPPRPKKPEAVSERAAA